MMRKSLALFGMLLAGVLIAQPSRAQVTRGNVDGVNGDGAGAVSLGGWACKVGESLPSARAMTLKLYAGGEAGKGGVELGTYTADQRSEQAVNDICRNAYLYNRFVIGLSIAVRQQHGGKPLYVYADTFDPAARYQLLPGSGRYAVPTAPAVSDAVYYIHTDRLGSNVIMTDAQANVVAKTDYKAYGAAVDSQQKNEAPGYTGHYEDPLTGLTYMQGRYYDAELGAFYLGRSFPCRCGRCVRLQPLCIRERQSAELRGPGWRENKAAWGDGGGHLHPSWRRCALVLWLSGRRWLCWRGRRQSSSSCVGGGPCECRRAYAGSYNFESDCDYSEYTTKL